MIKPKELGQKKIVQCFKPKELRQKKIVRCFHSGMKTSTFFSGENSLEIWFGVKTFTERFFFFSSKNFSLLVFSVFFGGKKKNVEKKWHSGFTYIGGLY